MSEQGENPSERGQDELQQEKEKEVSLKESNNDAETTSNNNENDGDRNSNYPNGSPREKTKKQHFVAEFERLQTSLAKEATRIVKPEFKEYSPHIWTSLKPYHNTYTVEFMLNQPDHVRHGYITRKTAIGLVDPEVSHSMDVVVADVPETVASDPRDTYFWMKQKSSRDKKNDGKKEGSTRLPKWPVVTFQKPDIALQKEINWGDVPKLREELKGRYSGNAKDRFNSDFARTKQDWYRMELEELKNIREVNRGHMQTTCYTYLGTSNGSRKAVSSLAKVLD